MTAVPLTALLFFALAGVDGTAIDLQAGGRVQASSRVLGGEGSTTRQASMDVLPRIALLLDRKTLRLTLQYVPQLRVMRDFAGAGPAARMVHGAIARGEWDVDPLWRVIATARGAERLIDFAAPLGAEVPRPLDVREQANARQLDYGASAGIEGRPWRRIALTAGVDADSSEGLGFSGRTAIPLLQKVRLAGGASREQTRVDVLRLDAAEIEARFDSGATASILTLTGGWTRQATRYVRLRLTAGASDATGSVSAGFIPEGEGVVEITPPLLGGPFRAAATLHSGAALDRWTARVQDRVLIEGDVGWSPSFRWTLRTVASWQEDRDRRGVSAMRGELLGSWRATPRVAYTSRIWNERQNDPSLADETLSYWGAMIGLDLLPNGRL